jgi:hypothetical protein
VRRTLREAFYSLKLFRHIKLDWLDKLLLSIAAGLLLLAMLQGWSQRPAPTFARIIGEPMPASVTGFRGYHDGGPREWSAWFYFRCDEKDLALIVQRLALSEVGWNAASANYAVRNGPKAFARNLATAPALQVDRGRVFFALSNKAVTLFTSPEGEVWLEVFRF